MAEFDNDDQIRVVVLSGAGGKAFISGADISEFGEKRSSPETVLEYNRISGRANAAIINFPKPTIAMIQGYCVGGGLAWRCAAIFGWLRKIPASRCPPRGLGLAMPMTASSG